MITLRLVPGSTGAALQAIDLFGRARVDAGDSWVAPVRVLDLSEDEARFATEFFHELGLEVHREPPAAQRRV